MFSGKYQDENGAIVELKENGDVEGLEGIKKYAGELSYGEPGLNIDQIRLGPNFSDSKSYGFKFDGDTLFLYQLNCVEYDSTSAECLKNDFGEQYKKLVRQK